MAILPRFFALVLAIGSAYALVSSETLNPPAPKAISDLRDAIVKGLGFQSGNLTVSGFDVRDALVGQAVAYEFDVEVGKVRVPVKLLEDVDRWDFVDLPIFRAASKGGGEAKELAEIGRRRRVDEARVSPALPPFQLAGPMELWIQDGDDLRLSLPHDVEAGTLKRVMLSDGAVVTVKGARSVSLRRPLDLPLPLNRTRTHKSRQLASGLLTLARALRQAARSNQKPLLSLQIVGPTSLSHAPSPAPNDKLKLKLKRLAPGSCELSSRTAPDADAVTDDDDDVELSHASTLWPLTSLNGSNSNLGGFEELLASVLGKKGDEEGSFRLLKAQVSAQTYVKMGFAVEKGILDEQADWSGFPRWKTKPKKVKVHFEVLARVEDGGKVVPERIEKVRRPYQLQEVLADNVRAGNVSMSKMELLHPAQIYFAL